LFLRCSTTSIKTGVSGPFNLHTTLDATHGISSGLRRFGFLREPFQITLELLRIFDESID
jgi:hypothetical protein